MTTADIIAATADHFRVCEADLLGSSRFHIHTEPRFAAVWAARKVTGHSMARLGRAFGGRDHATIHNAIQRAEALRDHDGDYRRKTDALLKKVLAQ